MIPRHQTTDARLGTGWRLLLLAEVATALGEIVYWRASRQHLGPAGTTPPRSEVVLVLGYPSRPGGRLHPLQRWRTEIAVRSLDPSCPEGHLVFSGASPRAGRSEAAVMAAYARNVLGVPSGRIVLEERARSTWENVAFGLAHLEGAETVKVASDPLHARKARRYLWQQRPDLAARLVQADDYRPLERSWLRFPLVVHAGASWLLRLRVSKESGFPGSSSAD
ncbi:MAG: YdcF family protein [Microlunatus sp.]|nr:YdcF family protein [Microlunatus sp.]